MHSDRASAVYYFLGLLAAMAVALAMESPERCNSPPLLTFKGDSYNHDTSQVGTFIGVYDQTEQKRAYLFQTTQHGHPINHWIIHLYKKNTTYEIETDGKTCEKFPSGKFIPFGVHAAAKFVKTYNLGGPKASLKVNQWYASQDLGGVSWSGSFTDVECYPITWYLFKNHREETTTDNFFNITLGVQMPQLFEPPSYCLS